MNEQIIKQFKNFLSQPAYPCIGAKAAVKKKLIDILVVPDMHSSEKDEQILEGIYKFISTWKSHQEALQTFVVIFETPIIMTEIIFEKLLWERLQSLHDLDRKHYPWDSSVSSDVKDAKFCLSLGNYGFFIVGLHPNSSRKARQFIRPTLAFNLHEQFENLRHQGIFDLMRDKIREREITYSGSINPLVKDFGEASEALQYSGRKVEEAHLCPFIARTKV